MRRIFKNSYDRVLMVIFLGVTLLLLPPLNLSFNRVKAEEAGSPRSFIDWANLKNPILSVPDRMLKDQAVVFDGREFFIFASTRFADNDPERETKLPCFYRTRDFKSYECFFDPDLQGSLPKGWQGPGSPDVVQVQGLWYMVFQAGPTDNEFRRLYFSTSKNLVDWGPARELMPQNRPWEREIDGALAYEHGFFYVGYKGGQKFFVVRSLGPVLDGKWSPPRRASADGAWAENFQFLKVDGIWRLIATARDPRGNQTSTYTRNHETYLYTREGESPELSAWTRWKEKTRLEIPREDWNQVMTTNCGYLCDWRQYDGYFYLFYAGANDDKTFQRRGHGKIGVARSRDLRHWRLPGDVSD